MSNCNIIVRAGEAHVLFHREQDGHLAATGGDLVAKLRLAEADDVSWEFVPPRFMSALATDQDNSYDFATGFDSHVSHVYYITFHPCRRYPDIVHCERPRWAMYDDYEWMMPSSGRQYTFAQFINAVNDARKVYNSFLAEARECNPKSAFVSRAEEWPMLDEEPVYEEAAP